MHSPGTSTTYGSRTPDSRPDSSPRAGAMTPPMSPTTGPRGHPSLSQSPEARSVASERRSADALWDESPISASSIARLDIGGATTNAVSRPRAVLGASTPHTQAHPVTPRVAVPPAQFRHSPASPQCPSPAAQGTSPRVSGPDTSQPSGAGPGTSQPSGVGLGRNQPSGVGSWIATRLDRLDLESTANDAAIATALAQQLAEADRQDALLAANAVAANAELARRRRASDPGPPDRNPVASASRYREALSLLTARDEALAIALALAEEEAAGLPRRRLLRPAVPAPAPALVFPAPSFPPADEDAPFSPGREGEKVGEKCIACEDALVNCCLIPCGHVILCMRCARRVNPPRCPVCRVVFQQVVRTTKRTRNI